jgi:hypothetical protein
LAAFCDAKLEDGRARRVRHPSTHFTPPRCADGRSGSSGWICCGMQRGRRRVCRG